MSVTAVDQLPQEDDSITPAESANSFPKSHQILYRAYSDASSVVSDVDFQQQKSAALQELNGLGIESPAGGSPKKLETCNGTAEKASFKTTTIASPPAVVGTSIDSQTNGISGHLSGAIKPQTATIQAIAKGKDVLTNGSLEDLAPSSLSRLSTLAEQGSTISRTDSETDGPGSVADQEDYKPDQKRITQISKHINRDPEISPSLQGNQETATQLKTETETDLSSRPTSSDSTSSSAQSNAQVNAARDQAVQSRFPDHDLKASVSGGEKQVINGGGSEEEKESERKSDLQERSEETSAAAPNTPSQNVLSKRGSDSNLSPASQPFFPRANTMASGEEDKFKTPTRTWNVNAAAFVPSTGVSTSETTPSDVSGSDNLPWPHSGQMQFGTLPNSLSASPMPGPNDTQEWKAEKYGLDSPHEASQTPEWQRNTWDSGYQHSAMYTDENGYSWSQQEDGQWICWDPQAMANGQESWGYHSYHDGQEYQSGPQGEAVGSRNHRPRHRRQWGFEERRASEAALAEVLCKHFSRSQELVASVLELHDGTIKGALDMLGQLEGESKGQLFAHAQDAPELNEENFPSLGSAGKSAEEESSPSHSKGGFANAVKAANATSSPQEEANGTLDPPVGEAPIKFWHDEVVTEDDSRTAAQNKAEYHASLRDQLFEKAMWAAYHRDYQSADAWASQGKRHSDEVVQACVEAEQVLYKHRSLTPKRRRGRLSGPMDLVGLSEKEAIAELENEISKLTDKRTRSPNRLEQRLYLLLGYAKDGKMSRSMPQLVEEWLAASQMKHTKTEPGFIELNL